jgi:hypothetical protein
MGLKHTDECLRKTAPDEPIFVLCARDASAPKFVRGWAADAKARGVRQEKVDEAYELADKMDNWYRNRLHAES